VSNGFNPDPIRSTNLSGVLIVLLKNIMEKYNKIPLGDDDLQQYLIVPRTTLVLGAHFFWMPEQLRLGLGQEYNFFLTRRGTGEIVLPLLAATGRGDRKVMALGGAVSLDISFRLFLVVGAPPAQDVVEKVAFTTSHIARVLYAISYNPPFWWLIEVNEEDVISRPEEGELTIGVVSGTIRGMPHLIPPAV